MNEELVKEILKSLKSLEDKLDTLIKLEREGLDEITSEANRITQHND